MENLRELYDELVAEAIGRQSTDSKANKIRTFVQSLSEYLGSHRLCMEAVYGLASRRVENLGKGYFTSVVRKTWTTETDEQGVEWIRTDRPKRRCNR